MEYLLYIFIFYIGFYFYRLAENYEKNKWLFGISGVITFVISYFISLILYSFFLLVDVDNGNYTNIKFMSFITGLIFVFLSFQILNFMWKKKKKIKHKEVDEIGKQ